jgi:DNA repair protein RadA/Sms
VSPSVVAIGEVGLAGELRAVSGMARRIQEARRLGARAIILPASAEVVDVNGVALRRCHSLVEAIAAARLDAPPAS